MRIRRLTLLALPLAASAFLLECVAGDTPIAPVVEAGTDTGQPPVDSGNDVAVVPDSGTDAKADAPPPCIIPDSGTPGSLDLTFSNAVNTLTSGFAASDITVDALGQTYVAGGATNCVSGNSGLDFALVRLTQGGAVDTTFNPANKPKCVSFGTIDSVYSVRIDPDGKIVVAGLAGGPSSFFPGVARFAATGALDATFGTGGKVDPLGVDAGVAPYAGFVVAFDVAFDASTKKIWIVGGDNNDNPNPTGGYIARLNTNGGLDIGFATSTGGILHDATVDAFWSAADDGAGGIYAAGQTKSSPRRMIVKHFDASGNPDSTFGFAGAAVVAAPDASAGDRGRSMLRTADGRLLVAGSSYGPATGVYFAGPASVARLTAKGAADPAFGGGVLVANPKLIFDSMYMNHMLGQLCDGTVLIAGRFDAVATGQDMGLIKLDPTGVAVPSFGTSGIASLPLAANQIPIGAAQDPKSGKVVVIGRTQVGGELVGARFNP